VMLTMMRCTPRRLPAWLSCRGISLMGGHSPVRRIGRLLPHGGARTGGQLMTFKWLAVRHPLT